MNDDNLLRLEVAARQADELRGIFSQVRRHVEEARAEFALIPDGIAEPILDTIGHRLESIHEAVLSPLATYSTPTNMEVIARVLADVHDAEKSGDFEGCDSAILGIVSNYIERNRHPETRAIRSVIRSRNQAHENAQRRRTE